MPTLTLAISEDLKSTMDSLPEINWSEIAREAISNRAAEFLLFRSIVAKSKLSKKDALKLGSKVNEGLYKRYKKAFERLK
ncbi:hypothetical protein HYT56_03915 [Candidatus Woesearchaeota archaeon]|nr:hypothetical protein [Candidatus Woesearchaeota archaeon]